MAAKDFFSQLTKICPFTQFFKAVFLPVPCTRLWKVCCSVAWDLGLSQTKVENREEKYGKHFKYLVAECFQILTVSEILDKNFPILLLRPTFTNLPRVIWQEPTQNTRTSYRDATKCPLVLGCDQLHNVFLLQVTRLRFHLFLSLLTLKGPQSTRHPSHHLRRHKISYSRIKFAIRTLLEPTVWGTMHLKILCNRKFQNKISKWTYPTPNI